MSNDDPFGGSPIQFCLNVMLSEYDAKATITQSVKQFPTGLIFSALNTAKSNKGAIKAGAEGLLDLTIAAMERHLFINQTVIRCSLGGVDKMEDLV